LGVGIGALVVQFAEPAQDLVDLLRIEFLLREEAAQRLRVGRALTRLAAELADLVAREPAAGTRVAHRHAVVRARHAGERRVALSLLTLLAVLPLLALLAVLPLLTPLAVLPLLALLAVLPLLSLLAVLPLLSLLTALSLLALLAALSLLALLAALTLLTVLPLLL